MIIYARDCHHSMECLLLQVVSNFRLCFMASKGCVLVSADYRQLELRIMTHFTSDPMLIKFFTDDTQPDVFISVWQFANVHGPYSPSIRRWPANGFTSPCIWSAPLIGNRPNRSAMGSCMVFLHRDWLNSCRLMRPVRNAWSENLWALSQVFIAFLMIRCSQFMLFYNIH